jgi:hypothetical protein
MHSPLAAGLGIAFVLVGTLTIVVAAVQHKRFIATLPQSDLPRAYSKSLAFVLSLLVGMLGVVLAGYLVCDVA